MGSTGTWYQEFITTLDGTRLCKPSPRKLTSNPGTEIVAARNVIAYYKDSTLGKWCLRDCTETRRFTRAPPSGSASRDESARSRLALGSLFTRTLTCLSSILSKERLAGLTQPWCLSAKQPECSCVETAQSNRRTVAMGARTPPQHTLEERALGGRCTSRFLCTVALLCSAKTGLALAPVLALQAVASNHNTT